MEIKMKMYDTTIEWKEPHDDLSCSEMLDIFTRLMLAFGFHPDSVKQTIVELAEEYTDEDLRHK